MINNFKERIEKPIEATRFSFDLSNSDRTKLEAIQKSANIRNKSNVIRALINKYYEQYIAK